MRTLPIVGVLLVALGATVVGPATALTVTEDVHRYDDIPGCVAAIGHFYPGYTYNGGTLKFDKSCYNSLGYPPDPQSPQAAAANLGGGVVTINADLLHGFRTLRGWCMTGPAFTNPNGITIDITDILGGITRTHCKSVWPPGGAYFSVTSLLPSYSVKVHDTANFWGFDHLVFQVNVP